VPIASQTRIKKDKDCVILLRASGFESHSPLGCVFVFILCECFPVYVNALRCGHLPSKEPYQIFVNKIPKQEKMSYMY
jgi:hypothetical protein